jgi:hypothetical protein
VTYDTKEEETRSPRVLGRIPGGEIPEDDNPAALD